MSPTWYTCKIYFLSKPQQDFGKYSQTDSKTYIWKGKGIRTARTILRKKNKLEKNHPAYLISRVIAIINQ